MGHRHDLRAVGDHFIGGVGADTPLIVEREPFECGTSARGKLLERQQHGMMFGLGDHDLVTRTEREPLCGRRTAAHRRVAEGGGQQIEARGGTGGHHKLFTPLFGRSANETGHGGTGIFERHRAACGELMGAAVHAGVDRLVESAFRIDHGLRLLGRGRRIQIHQRAPMDLLAQNRELPSNRLEIRHRSLQGQARADSESEPSGRYSSYPRSSSSSASSGPPVLTKWPSANTCTMSGLMYLRMRV